AVGQVLLLAPGAEGRGQDRADAGAVVNPARPRLSEEQQRELNARRDLEQLVKLLMDAASGTWHDPKISGRDRALHFGRGAALRATVDRLSKAILDHSDAGVRADRLVDLHDEIGRAHV